MMKRSDFWFELPEHLIAKHPLAERSSSRLLHLDAYGHITDTHFKTLPDLLQQGDVLVVNNTKVIKARLYGEKSTGGKVELLVERLLGTHDALAHIKASKAPKPDTVIHLMGNNAPAITVTGREGDLFNIHSATPLMQLLDTWGALPLPPYFSRQAEAADDERYQTVFHNPHKAASVAAPTAGLHFDQTLLDALHAKGVQVFTVTLHVGAGTFQPVRTENILDHTMHAEWGEVPQETVDAVLAAKQRGNKVIAVGTTATRALESAAHAHQGQLAAWQGFTDIFIYPGYTFKVIDRLITNFHLPESTLIMLVSALAGHQPIMHAYQHAVAQAYRFFSYGDAMLIDRAVALPT